MTLSKALIWAAVAIVIVVVVIAGGLYLIFVRGSRTSIALGGKWELEIRSTPMSHGGGSAELYRRDGWRRTRVEELVHENRYYGDDCIAYGTSRGTAGPSYYASCGDREPVLLGRREYVSRNGEPHLTDWRIEPDGATEVQSTNSGAIEHKLSVAEIKRRAMAQPPRKEGGHVGH